MRVTLKDQMDALEQKKQAIDDAVIDRYYEGKEKPTKFYVLCGTRPVEERNIDKIVINRYEVPGNRMRFIFSSARITKKIVAEMEEFLDQYHPDESAIAFHWSYTTEHSRCTSCDLLSDINKGDTCSFDKSVMEEQREKYIEKYGAKEGYEPCTYCRVQRKPEDLITGTIISRMWKDNDYKSPPRKYCKDDSCHGYDQMAHEG